MSRSSMIVSLEDVTSGSAIDDSWVSDIGANGGLTSEDTDLLVTSRRHDGYSTCATGSPTDNRVPLCSCSRTRFLGVFLLIIAIITTAAFMTPLLFHYLYPADLPPQNSSNSSNADLPSQNSSNSSNGSCFAYLPSIVTNKKCDAVPYDDDIHVHECTSVLSTWQKCKGVQSNEILVNFTAEQLELMKEFLNYQQLISSQCRNHAVQFLCQYTFHLCITRSGNEETLVLPDKSQCFELRDKFCSVEWKFLQNELPQVLPNCDLLPGTYNTTNTTDNVTCSAMFIEQNSSCVPGCLEFTTMDHKLSVFWRIGLIVLLLLGEIAALGVIVAFMVDRKKMCQYPLLYVLYITILWIISVLLLLIGRFHPQQLFCQHENLLTNAKNPTVFCLVTGVAVQWLCVCVTFLWLFLVSSVLYKAARHNPTPLELKLSKYIHILLTVVGILAPLPSVVVYIVVKKGRSGYTIAYYPPLFCVPTSSDLIYYSITLVVNLFVGLGVNFYLLIFWLIYKYRSFLRSRVSAHNKLSVVEMKLLFLYLYYVLFGITILSYAELARKGNLPFILNKYVTQCGVVKEDEQYTKNCSKLLSKMQKDGLNTLLIPFMLVTACIPFINLAFVLNWKRLGNLVVSVFAPSCRRIRNSLSVQH